MIGVGPPARIAVHDPLAGEHDGAGRQLVLADAIGHERTPADDPRRREESHALAQDGAREGEPRQIFRAELLGRHAVHLGVERRLDLGVLRQQIPGPREQIRRRLMSGEEERHRLVAKLAVAHPAAVSLAVLRHEQHGEEVAAILARCTTFGDEPIDRRVESLASATEAQRHRQREALEQLAEREHAQVERLDRRGERVADLVGLALDVGVEQRLADDGERISRHLAGHVESLAVAPALGAPRRVRRHRLGVRGDARTVERGLREPALPPVQLVLARQQTLAEQHLGALEAASLVEQPAVRDEHVADLVRMTHEHDRLRGDSDAGHVAVPPREVSEQGERTADHRQRELTRVALARSGHRAEAAAPAAGRGGRRQRQTVFSRPRRRQNCT